jgi:hypothetical protein
VRRISGDHAIWRWQGRALGRHGGQFIALDAGEAGAPRATDDQDQHRPAGASRVAFLNTVRNRAAKLGTTSDCISDGPLPPQLTQLHADAFVTLDEELARSVEGIVATASIDALR